MILAELFPQNVLLWRDGLTGGRVDGLTGWRVDGLTGGRVDGLTGGRVDGYQKGPLIFFILRYIKHYTHIYLYTK